MQPALFNCLWAKVQRCPRGEALPQMCFVVSFLIHSTGRMQQEQDRSTQSSVCVRKGPAEHSFASHVIPTQNISWKHHFWWLHPVEQQQNKAPMCLPEGASQPGSGRKRGEGMCVWGGDKSFSCFDPRWFLFLKKGKKNSQLLFSFSCLFSLEIVAFL